MGAMMIIAKLLHKSSDTINALSISLLMILIYNPFMLFDSGLILSYGGTIGILLFAKSSGNVKNYALKIVAVSSSAQAILAPIIAYLFCTIHPLFFISATISTPLFEVIILLGFAFLFAFPPICLIIKIPLELCVTLFLKTAQITSKLPLAQINISKPSIMRNYNILFNYYYICFIKNKDSKGKNHSYITMLNITFANSENNANIISYLFCRCRTR